MLGIRNVFFDILNGNYVATFGITSQSNSNEGVIHIVPMETSVTTQMTYFPGQNYPNPFYQNTRINYSIASSGGGEMILYDMQGRPCSAVNRFYNLQLNLCQ
jgi:hypothetical protein